MYCKKCGYEQKDGQKFCPRCGLPFTNIEYLVKCTERNSFYKSKWFIISVVFIVVILIVLILPIGNGGIANLGFLTSKPKYKEVYVNLSAKLVEEKDNNVIRYRVTREEGNYGIIARGRTWRPDNFFSNLITIPKGKKWEYSKFVFRVDEGEFLYGGPFIHADIDGHKRKYDCGRLASREIPVFYENDMIQMEMHCVPSGKESSFYLTVYFIESDVEKE